MSLDYRHVAIGIGIVVAGYFILKPKQSATEVINIAPSGKKNPQANIQLISRDEQATFKAKEIEELRRTHNLRLGMQLKSLPVKREGDRLQILVKTALEPVWCRSGDFDLLKAAVKDARKKEFAISLESIGDSSVRRGQSLSLADFDRNKPMRFSLPRSQNPIAVGLFICSDPEGKKSCKNKKIMPDNIWKAPIEQIAGKLQNRIFYFQYLILDENGLQLVPSEDWSEERFELLQKRLKDGTGASAKRMERMRKIIANLQPMPARISGETLEIPLPYNDPRCAE